MKLPLFIFALIWGANSLTQDEILDEWKNFKLNYSKTYKSPLEHKLRFEIFKTNLQLIENHNEIYKNGKTTYTKGVTKFTDWTQEEFIDYVNLYEIPNKTSMSTFKYDKSVKLADSIDWRDQGAVADIKDQGQCGSCWSFSATGSLEAQLKIKKGKLISLSEQNLVDCSNKYGNMGCFGGLMTSAFNYIKDNGLESESDYPYEAQNRKCRFDKNKSVVSISGYVQLNRTEDDLVAALATVGPISVGIAASIELQLYKGGILIDEICGSMTLNHGVTVVGYGTEKGLDYYIIRNSWGGQWGEQGYFRMIRNKNMCGITTDCSYPIVV